MRRTIWIRYGSRDTVLANNVFQGSAMSIMLGGTSGSSRIYADPVPPSCLGVAPDHWGGLVCNNAIDGLTAPAIGSADFEEGIARWSACESWAIHNTVVSPAGAETYHDLELRFAGTYVHLVNNLLETPPFLRDSAAQDPAYTASNAQYGSPNDFVDTSAAADLHLQPAAPEQPGASIASIGMCMTDGGGKPRNLTAPMIGAYER